MNGVGIRKGDVVMLSIMVNGGSFAELVVSAVESNVASCSLYVDDETDMILIHELLTMALHTIAYKLEQPNLKKMLADRIAELRAEEAEESETPSSPTDYDDIPF